MFKVPALKWIDSLEKGRKMAVMLMIAIMALSSVVIILFNLSVSLWAKNEKIQKDKEKQIVECEKEKNEMSIKYGQALLDYKTQKDNEINQFLQSRINDLQQSNNFKDSALKIVREVTDNTNRKIQKINKIIK